MAAKLMFVITNINIVGGMDSTHLQQLYWNCSSITRNYHPFHGINMEMKLAKSSLFNLSNVC